MIPQVVNGSNNNPMSPNINMRGSGNVNYIMSANMNMRESGNGIYNPSLGGFGPHKQLSPQNERLKNNTFYEFSSVT